MNKCQKTIINILLLFMSVIISLILGEIFLRLLWKDTENSLRGITVPDKTLGYRFLPEASKKYKGMMNDFETLININSAGFRSKYKQVSESIDAKRILLFGDSDVFGLGVDEKDMLDACMEKILNTHIGKNYEVVNFGIPNIGTLEEEYIFENHGIFYNPDIIVFLITVSNDLSNNIRFLERNAKSDNFSRAESDVQSSKKIHNLYLFKFAKWRLFPFLAKFPFVKQIVFTLYKPSIEDLPPLINEWYYGNFHEESLVLMKDAFIRTKSFCEQKGIEMIIAAIPTRVQFNKEYEKIMLAMTPASIISEYYKDKRKPQRVIKEFCESNSIHYVEILDKFIYLSQEEHITLRYPNDGHLNARGTLEVAKILADYVQDIVHNNGHDIVQ